MQTHRGKGGNSDTLTSMRAQLSVKASVGVYVITYDGMDFLERCFATLGVSTRFPQFSVTLIDNGSSDGSGEFVKKRFPHVDIVRIEPNAGYAHAANRAVSEAKKNGDRYVVLCNDDIEFVDERWLDEAISRLERDPTIAVVVFREASPGSEFEILQTIDASDVEYLSGFVMVIPTSVFDLIGKFDERNFVIAEEDDLGARALKSGLRLIRLDLPIIHHGGGTNQHYSTRTSYLQMRNGIRFCIKNRSFWRAALRVLRVLDVACSPLPITFDPEDAAHRRMRGDGRLLLNAWSLLRAVSWNVVALPDTLRIRRRDRGMIEAARSMARLPANHDSAACADSVPPDP